MERFCDDLRQQREQRHVSLEAISGITKVSARHLQALEAGHYDELPGGVFRKGILRSYLGALGIEPTPWVQRFDTILVESGASIPINAEALDEFARNVRDSRPRSRSTTGHPWLNLLMMLLGLAAVCSFIWIVALHGHLAT